MAQTQVAWRTDHQQEAHTVRSRLFTVLTAVTAVVIVLQGVWAGLFIHEGRDYQQSWVDVHARGGDLAIGLALVATVVAVVKLRSRPVLVAGSFVLMVLLALEAFLGGLIGDAPAMTVVHFPLALALMALAIWLPLRSARG